MPIGPGDDILAANMRPAGTLAFNSNGELIGMGPAYRIHSEEIEATADAPAVPAMTRFLPVQRRVVDDDGSISTSIADLRENGWQINDTNEFSMHIVPISGTTPRATFGNTQGRYMAYGDDAAANETGLDDIRVPVGSMIFQMATFFNRGGMNTNAGFEMLDGNPPGVLRDISFGRDGTIMGMFTNGVMRVLGQVPVAMFRNPAGLERMGNNLWAATANSGDFDGIGTIGDIIGGALEMSNVDLAQEFTEMITTQRGFQASSRLISVSDEMIQELVNLRR
jgi:flagellar hook-basal body protein